MKYSSMVLALLLIAGFAFAVQPAENWNVISTGKYDPGAGASHVTEGGNVTGGDLYSNVSTEKWAGYYGNVTGEIVLAETTYTNLFYNWAWTPADGGKVCAIAGTGFNWAGLATLSNATIDSVWGFTVGDTDSGTNTFADGVCTMTIAGVTPAATTAVTTLGGSGFETCAFDDGGGTLPADVAFCVDIQDNQTLFNSGTGDFQLLVATNETTSQYETYYFWLELN